MNLLPVFDRRRSGILLHPTSLPRGHFGDARRFIDFLADTGTSVWQMLPLGPTHADASPYHCLSVHALNPELLAEPAATISKFTVSEHHAFEAFCEDEAHWLEDYTLFTALRRHHQNKPWWQWPIELRDRQPAALKTAANMLAAEIQRVRIEQFRLAVLFNELRHYAHSRGVRLFGDLPIFVAHDSADVWAHRSLFKLDESGQPRVVAGVPPDYFSATGQRWGNPHYDWTQLAADGFRWWLDRLATELKRFDLLRIDHFRGFEACWEVPAGEPTAMNGRWVPVPGDELFTAIRARFGQLPLVAEDLGTITPEVTALRQRHGLPGMLVLQFAFEGGPDNPYLPQNHVTDAVVYTGTHDNDTTLSWFEKLDTDAQEHVLTTLDSTEPMPRALVQVALQSVAQLAIIPLQDVLELGAGHRMNTPGTAAGNWRWRFGWEQLTSDTRERWKTSVKRTGRAV